MNKQVDSEFSRTSVPMEERKSYFSLTIVWTGFVFVITSMMAGGGLAAGLNMTEILLATVLGNIFLCVITVLLTTVASKTGLTFALLTRYCFGSTGSRIASLFVPIVNIGWYTIQAAAYGHFISTVFNIGATGEYIIMALSAIVMGIFAIRGIKSITVLGYIAIPAIVFLSICTAIRATWAVGGVEALFNYTPATNMSLMMGITIVIGTWILSCSTCVADIMRFARTPKEGVMAAATGLLGGNILMIMCGAIAAIGVKNSDLTVILLSFGLIIPSLILMTTNIFTTNAANLYSTSLNLANAFNVSRNKILYVILSISAVLTAIKPYEIGQLFVFLGTLGTIVPPLPGIVLADYFIIHKGSYLNLEQAKLPKWNIISWLVWIVSAFIAYMLPFGLVSLNGLLLGAGLYIICMKIFSKK